MKKWITQKRKKEMESLLTGDVGFNKLFYKGKEIKNVDNGTFIMTIPTPSKWKCSIKKCKINFKHIHNLFTYFL